MTSMAEPRKPSAGVTVFPLRQLHSHYRTHTLDTPGQQPQFIGGLMLQEWFHGIIGIRVSLNVLCTRVSGALGAKNVSPDPGWRLD